MVACMCGCSCLIALICNLGGPRHVLTRMRRRGLLPLVRKQHQLRKGQRRRLLQKVGRILTQVLARWKRDGTHKRPLEIFRNATSRSGSEVAFMDTRFAVLKYNVFQFDCQCTLNSCPSTHPHTKSILLRLESADNVHANKSVTGRMSKEHFSQKVEEYKTVIYNNTCKQVKRSH